MRNLTSQEMHEEEKNPGITRIYKVLARFQVAAVDKREVKSIIEEFTKEHGTVGLIEMQVDEIRRPQLFGPKRAKSD
ncbi:MAG TPA: hypothetical protein VGS11_04560 [Candidatus Bathyarchaeia archaeon]|nr:hypothetical protein [Candidatus Bathyarchaeia archaeon]